MMNRKGPWEGYSLRAHFHRRERRLGTRQHKNSDNNSARFYNGEKLCRAEWRITNGIGVHAIPGGYPVHIVCA